MFDVLHVYHDGEPKSGALNMAVDEALLQTATCPTLRFYYWSGRAISFGYFGRFADVADQQPHHDIVRRWTGGGIVFHGSDLTYSMVIPARHCAFAYSSISIYEKIHRVLCNVLVLLGQPTVMAGAADPGAAVSDGGDSGRCFANPVRADVLLNGRKVAGAAHRRSRAGLLHQGSIQLEEWPAQLADDFARALCPDFEGRVLSRPLIDHAGIIARAKYATSEWLTRR